jgi:proliferating cell nuclear antigen PCNA
MEITWGKDNNSLQIFKAVEKTNTIINIILNQYGLMIMGMDSSKTSLVKLVLPNSYFDNFRCPTPMEFGIHTASLVSILSKAKNNKMSWKATSANALSICLGDDPTQTEFCLRCIDVCEDQLNIPEIDHDVSFEVSSVILTEILDKMSMAKSDLKFKIDNRNLKLMADSIEFGKICHIESLENEDRFQSTINQTVCLTFGYNAIQMILCFCKVSKNKCQLALSSTMPLKLKITLGTGAFLAIYIAPKMMEDDNE